MKKMVVFNLRTAGFLMLMGHPLRSIAKNKNNPNMNVFIFDDTEDLRNKISKYDEFISFNQITK